MAFSGRYDHPAYLARMCNVLGVNVAGTTNQAAQAVYPWPIKIHTINVVVKTAGTAAGAKINLMNGTATIGGVTVGTATAGSVAQSTTDLAYTLPSGSVVGVLASGDIVAVANVIMEYSIPTSGTWLGGE